MKSMFLLLLVVALFIVVLPTKSRPQIPFRVKQGYIKYNVYQNGDTVARAKYFFFDDFGCRSLVCDSLIESTNTLNYNCSDSTMYIWDDASLHPILNTIINAVYAWDTSKCHFILIKPGEYLGLQSDIYFVRYLIDSNRYEGECILVNGLIESIEVNTPDPRHPGRWLNFGMMMLPDEFQFDNCKYYWETRKRKKEFVRKCDYND